MTISLEEGFDYSFEYLHFALMYPWLAYFDQRTQRVESSQLNGL